jgi:hypothetical protein
MFDTAHVLFRQTAGALHSVACDILNEDPATEEHAARKVWARKVLLDNDGPVVEADRWMWSMLTNYILAASPTTTDDSTVKAVTIDILPIMLKQHQHV